MSLTLHLHLASFETSYTRYIIKKQQFLKSYFKTLHFFPFINKNAFCLNTLLKKTKQHMLVMYALKHGNRFELV